MQTPLELIRPFRASTARNLNIDGKKIINGYKRLTNKSLKLNSEELYPLIGLRSQKSLGHFVKVGYNDGILILR